MRWGHSELEPAGSVVLSVRDQNTRANSPAGTQHQLRSIRPAPSISRPPRRQDQHRYQAHCQRQTGRGGTGMDASTTTIPVTPRAPQKHHPEAENSASQPRRKTRTYCHTGFVYKSLRQGPPHAPLRIRRKNGDIRRLIALSSKTRSVTGENGDILSGGPCPYHARAHEAPKPGRKKGARRKNPPRPMAGKTAKTRAGNPGTEGQRSPGSTPEYIMTSWRMSTSRPSSIAIIMSSASAIILA